MKEQLLQGCGTHLEHGAAGAESVRGALEWLCAVLSTTRLGEQKPLSLWSVVGRLMLAAPSLALAGARLQPDQ